jgi:hypothetical protein
MRKLERGQSLIVTNWTVSQDVFMRGNASFDLKITRLQQEGKPAFRAERFMEKGKPASRTQVWEAALLQPDAQFSVYGWSPAKIGNRPFQVRTPSFQERGVRLPCSDVLPMPPCATLPFQVLPATSSVADLFHALDHGPSLTTLFLH